MPTYEIKCNSLECSLEDEIFCSMGTYKYTLENTTCQACNSKVSRHHRSTPGLSLPAGSTYNGQMTVKIASKPGDKQLRKAKEQLLEPLNIWRKNPDGSMKVIRMGSKTDIDNE